MSEINSKKQLLQKEINRLHAEMNTQMSRVVNYDPIELPRKRDIHLKVNLLWDDLRSKFNAKVFLGCEWTSQTDWNYWSRYSTHSIDICKTEKTVRKHCSKASGILFSGRSSKLFSQNWFFQPKIDAFEGTTVWRSARSRGHCRKPGIEMLWELVESKLVKLRTRQIRTHWTTNLINYELVKQMNSLNKRTRWMNELVEPNLTLTLRGSGLGSPTPELG